MKNTAYKLIVILGVIGVSFSAIFVKYATVPSMVLALYRMGFAAILLLPVVTVKFRDELKQLKRSDWLLCMLSGFFLACHFSAYFESLKHTSVASSTVLVDMEVFFVALVTVFLFHERISKAAVTGILLTFAGSIVLALTDSSEGSNIVYGDALAILGAVFVSVYTLIGRHQRTRMTTTVYTFLVYASASVTLLVFCLVSGNQIAAAEPVNYIWGLLLTLCCTFFGHSVFSWSLKYAPAAFVSTAKLGEPVFATIMSVFLFGEMPKPMQVAGGLIILGGLCLYTAKE